MEEFPEIKVCTRCEIEKPSSEFGKRGNKLHSWCKECKLENNKRYKSRTKYKHITMKQWNEYQQLLAEKVHRERIEGRRLFSEIVGWTERGDNDTNGSKE